MRSEEPLVRSDGHRIHVRDYPGPGPAIVLMHGFPDDLHLYDGLVPLLTPSRRIVTIDFLGWGDSDKPGGYRHASTNQARQLEAVIDALESMPRARRRDPDSVAEAARRAVRSAIGAAWNKKPMCHVQVLTV